MINAILYVGKVNRNIWTSTISLCQKIIGAYSCNRKKYHCGQLVFINGSFLKNVDREEPNHDRQLRKNKKEIPTIYLTGKIIGESKFAFDDNKTLVSFMPKKIKVVLLLSTMHHSDIVNEDTKKIHTNFGLQSHERG